MVSLQIESLVLCRASEMKLLLFLFSTFALASHFILFEEKEEEQSNLNESSFTSVGQRLSQQANIVSDWLMLARSKSAIEVRSAIKSRSTPFNGLAVLMINCTDSEVYGEIIQCLITGTRIPASIEFCFQRKGSSDEEIAALLTHYLSEKWIHLLSLKHRHQDLERDLLRTRLFEK